MKNVKLKVHSKMAMTSLYNDYVLNELTCERMFIIVNVRLRFRGGFTMHSGKSNDSLSLEPDTNINKVMLEYDLSEFLMQFV
jgi:hypothetical protein